MNPKRLEPLSPEFLPEPTAPKPDFTRRLEPAPEKRSLPRWSRRKVGA